MAELHHEEKVTKKAETQNYQHLNDDNTSTEREASHLEPFKMLTKKQNEIKSEILDLKSTLAEIRKDGTILRSFVKYRTDPLFSKTTIVNDRKHIEAVNKNETYASQCGVSRAEFEELKNMVTTAQGDIRTLKSTMQSGFAMIADLLKERTLNTHVGTAPSVNVSDEQESTVVTTRALVPIRNA